MKWTIVDSAREVCGLLRVRKKNPKNVCWNDVVKVSVDRKEAAGTEVLRAWVEVSKERRMEVYKEKKVKG